LTISPEQEQVAHYVRRLQERTRPVVVALARQLELLSEYRQALITAAVTGDLDITSFDGEQALEEAAG
jgi:hypothetical protein